MYIMNHMSNNPVTINPDTSISEAKEIVSAKNFRHLPVTDEQGKMVGMVTDRDLRSAYPSTVLTEEEKQACIAKISEKPVHAIMSTKFVTLTPVSTLDDALFLLDRDKVGALPVLDESGKIVGIFSIRDLIKAYKELYGVGEKGSSLVVVEDDGQPHPLTRITQTLEEHAIDFTRLVKPQQTNTKDSAGFIYIRVNTFNLHAVHNALEESGFTLVTPGTNN